MELNEYQTKLIELWETPPDCDHLLLCAVGIAEEAGEALGKVKRLMRGDGFDREGYLLELGDCLAYVSISAHIIGIELDESVKSEQKNISGIIATSIELYEIANGILQVIYERVNDFGVVQVMYLDMKLALSLCSAEAKSSLEEVMQLNITKLEDRIARLGTLKGSGDKR